MSHLDIISDNSNKNLQNVPQRILEMCNLKMLYLDGNAIRRLPSDFFDKLTRLTWLDLRSNQLREIPANIAYHGFLETLLLQNNNIEYLPNELGTCPNLETLLISGNPIKYPSPKIIENGTSSICSFLEDRYYRNATPSIEEEEEEEDDDDDDDDEEMEVKVAHAKHHKKGGKEDSKKQKHVNKRKTDTEEKDEDDEEEEQLKTNVKGKKHHNKSSRNDSKKTKKVEKRKFSTDEEEEEEENHKKNVSKGKHHTKAVKGDEHKQKKIVKKKQTNREEDDGDDEDDDEDKHKRHLKEKISPNKFNKKDAKIGTKHSSRYDGDDEEDGEQASNDYASGSRRHKKFTKSGTSSRKGSLKTSEDEEEKIKINATPKKPKKLSLNEMKKQKIQEYIKKMEQKLKEDHKRELQKNEASNVGRRSKESSSDNESAKEYNRREISRRETLKKERAKRDLNAKQLTRQEEIKQELNKVRNMTKLVMNQHESAPVLFVKSLSRDNTIDEDFSENTNVTLDDIQSQILKFTEFEDGSVTFLRPAHFPKKNHQLTKNSSKVSITSHLNSSKYVGVEKIKSNENRTSEEAIKHMWLDRLKQLLSEQEQILQQERNLNALSKWRSEKKIEPPRKVSAEEIPEPPFDTDPEYATMLSRKDLSKHINNVIKKTKKSATKVDIEKLINEVVDKLKIMEVEKEPDTPRRSQQFAQHQIQSIIDLHKKIIALQSTNDSL